MTGTHGGSGAGTRPAWGRAGVLAVLLGLVFVAARPSLAQTTSSPVIADVIVRGNRNITTSDVMRHLKTRVGNEYQRSTVRDDVARLAKTNMFRNVSSSDEMTPDGRIVVYFNVQEHPNLIQEVVYKNAHHISKADLESMTGLKKGQPLNPTAARRACFEIQDHLKKKGRYFATVTLEEGDKEGDSQVVFNITEGPIVRVRSIRYTGQDKLATAARLNTQIDATKAFLGVLGGKFNPAIVDNDVLKLEEYYRNNGFMDVRVTRELVFSDDFQHVDVVFHIQEGIQYRVQGVQVEGTRQLDRNQVSSVVRMREGEKYNEGVVTADLRNITDLYGWRGYGITAQKELYFPEPGLVRVVYEVRERPPAKVGLVHIFGNEVTKENIIRRQIGLYPGQPLQYPELRLAERNLARLGIFETNPETGVRPTVTVVENPESEHQDVIVQVKEGKTGSLMFGVGVNSDAGLVGSIVLNEKNFDIMRPPTSLNDVFEGRAWRGAGQELRIEAVPGTELQRYSISFREPFLFDLPYSFSVSGYYYDRVFHEYIEGRTGTRITLGRQITKEWGVSGGIRVENVQVRDVPFFAPADYQAVRGGNFVAAPRVGITYDTRDSYLRPTEGGVFEAHYEQVLGDYTFPIFNVEGSRYFTLWQRPDGSGRHVLAARSQFAWAGDDAPVFERFFGGGFRSMRGFEFRGVGPFINDFNVGGRVMFLNSLEYQVPIRANDNLYLVAFLDTGTVERDLTIRDYRVTAGVGARIIVPMMGSVPIAIDFGFPIVRGPDDREQIFSFWVGFFGGGR
jgi:outer membrane protein insertion porin family